VVLGGRWGDGAGRYRGQQPVAEQGDFRGVGGVLGGDDVEAGIGGQHHVERDDQAAGGDVGLDEAGAAECDAEAVHGGLDRHETLVEAQAAAGGDRGGQTRGG